MIRIGKLPNSANRSSLVSLVLSTQGQCRVLEPLLYKNTLLIYSFGRSFFRSSLLLMRMTELFWVFLKYILAIRSICT